MAKANAQFQEEWHNKKAALAVATAEWKKAKAATLSMGSPVVSSRVAQLRVKLVQARAVVASILAELSAALEDEKRARNPARERLEAARAAKERARAAFDAVCQEGAAMVRRWNEEDEAARSKRAPDGEVDF